MGAVAACSSQSLHIVLDEGIECTSVLCVGEGERERGKTIPHNYSTPYAHDNLYVLHLVICENKLIET